MDETLRPAQGCGERSPILRGAMHDLPEHTPEQVAELLAAGAIQLVDVREPYEHEAGAIAGARHVVASQLGAASEQLDPATPIVFYCRVGARSAMATQAFRRSGRDARNLAGGIEAWVAHGLPLSSPDGYVAPH
jgi:rhodanese-related sulfurtransferase